MATCSSSPLRYRQRPIWQGIRGSSRPLSPHDNLDSKPISEWHTDEDSATSAPQSRACPITAATRQSRGSAGQFEKRLRLDMMKCSGTLRNSDNYLSFEVCSVQKLFPEHAGLTSTVRFRTCFLNCPWDAGFRRFSLSNPCGG
jgi:hypothetical protein